ncbi:MAG: hypothetical protein WC511_02090 [Candidatus Pacearchaeota archaeon]
MKIVYQSEDGSYHQTEKECREADARLVFRNELHIELTDIILHDMTPTQIDDFINRVDEFFSAVSKYVKKVEAQKAKTKGLVKKTL